MDEYLKWLKWQHHREEFWNTIWFNKFKPSSVIETPHFITLNLEDCFFEPFNWYLHPSNKWSN